MRQLLDITHAGLRLCFGIFRAKINRFRENMLSKEAGLNGGVHLLRLIREQIQVNKATYPEQYLQDEWKVRDSSINEYEEFFKPVTIKMGEAGIVVRCPGHTIHFLRYGYAEYVKTVLGFLNINPSLIDWNKYDTWNPYD